MRLVIVESCSESGTVAFKVDSWVALRSLLPADDFSHTTAFGFSQCPSSEAACDGDMLPGTGVAFFCGCKLSRSLSCGSIDMISGGMPFSGNSEAFISTCSMSRCW